MILPISIALACTPKMPIEEAIPCESGFVLDGLTCVPETCGTGRWGDLPVDDETVFVDVAGLEGGDGSEAAPYAAIQQGLDRAGAQGGALVAVAAGIYPETLSFTIDHADVRLAGRCREMVFLDASVGDEETPGIEIDAGMVVVDVSGLTVRDAPRAGLEVASGMVTVRDAAITESAYIGVYAHHFGFEGETGLLMEGCLIEGNVFLGLYDTDSGTEVTLRDTNVSLTRSDSNGNGGHGIEVDDGATLSSETCLIERNTGLGVLSIGSGAQITLRDTIVKSTQPDANGKGGRGVEVNDGATLSAEGCLIEGNSELGLLASTPGARVTLWDTTVKDTQPNMDGESGWGIVVQDGATLTAEGCLIEGNTELGMGVSDPGTQVALRDTIIRDTRLDGGGLRGWGVEVGDGATLLAEGCLIEENIGLGLLSHGLGTRLTLRDCTVRDSRPNGKGEDGRGIEVGDGATLSTENCLIERNTEFGVFASSPGTRADLRDTAVLDTLPSANGGVSSGIGVSDGATFFADGCLVEGNSELGLIVFDPGSVAALRDTTVCRTLPDANGGRGMGIEAQNGATLSVDGCLVDGNRRMGVIVSHLGTRAVLRDTTVRDTQPDTNGEYGRGIQVSDGATLHTEGCLIEGNTDVGLISGDPGTRVVLRETTVKNTRADANGRFGRGIDVLKGATLTAEGCLIEANTELGLIAGDPGTMVTLRDSTVSGTKPANNLWGSAATGVGVQTGAVVVASHVIVASNQGPGILVNSDSVLECAGCLLEGNEFAGAVAIRSGTLTISDSTIEGTTASANLLGGAGVYAWPWVGDPPTVTITNTLIRNNPIAGVWLIGNGLYLVSGNTIFGGGGESFGSGFRCGDAVLALDGVAAWDGSSGLLVQDNIFRDASGSGVFLDASSALLSGNSYSGNTVDLVVQNQDCDPMPEYSDAPRRDLCPDYDYPTCHDEFFFVAMPADPVEQNIRHPLFPLTP